MTLDLLPGMEPDGALRSLRDMAQDAENRRNNSTDGPSVKTQLGVWADRAENQLRHDFGIVPTLAFIQTQRFSYIQSMDAATPTLHGTVFAELGSQAERLIALADELKQTIAIFKAAPGHIVVPDTTAVLRMNPLPGLDLSEITGGGKARLVLPLRVVEELDAKKYGPNESFRTIVRKLLPKLEALLEAAPGPVADAGPTLTIEILVVPGPRDRIPDADGEILAVCQQLKQFTGQPVTVLTLDTAMRTRARAGGLNPVKPPPQLLRGSEVQMQAEADAAQEPD